MEKYASLLGELKEGAARAERIRTDLSHLEAVMRIYREDWSGDDVAPRRPSYANRYMKIGRGTQTALDVIREALAPMTVREIVQAVMARLEIPVTAAAAKSLDSTLRYTLAKHEGDGIVAEGLNPEGYRVAPSPAAA